MSWSRPHLCLWAKDYCCSRGLSAARDCLPSLGGWHPTADREVKKLAAALARGRGCFPPLGMTWCSPPARECCTPGELCACTARRPHWWHTLSSTFIFFKFLLWYHPCCNVSDTYLKCAIWINTPNIGTLQHLNIQHSISNSASFDINCVNTV